MAKRIFPPDDFEGFSFVTSRGHVFETGDADRQFTIQWISKPLAFWHGHGGEWAKEGLTRHVGVEPSGNTSN